VVAGHCGHIPAGHIVINKTITTDYFFFFGKPLFISEYAFGLMVLFFLLRLIPFFFRALILAYKPCAIYLPFFFDFIILFFNDAGNVFCFAVSPAFFMLAFFAGRPLLLP
tara:strand:- start:897 stop:1226 length:330 start_codon:yes stop_codon:yes gene_type:complete